MSNILKRRIKKLNSASKSEGKSIVYVMSRDQRVRDNHALIAAAKDAEVFNLPLVVYFNLYTGVSNRLLNQYDWMLAGLKEVEQELIKLNIGFVVGAGSLIKNLESIEQAFKPRAFYFDFSPLRGPKKTKNTFVKNSETPCYVVDTHNIVPVWGASEKLETAARTIRGKIHNLLDVFLVEPEELGSITKKLPEPTKHFNLKKIAWNELHSEIKAPYKKDYKPIVLPGEIAALKTLKQFISEKLTDYGELRNIPSEDALSNLSAYFHFGQLSTLRAALEIDKVVHVHILEIMKKKIPESKMTKQLQSAAAFLEESIIRKELADNYCYYNEQYDSLEGAAEWARDTLKLHKKDKREYTYSYEDLETAATHDPAWNAAQTQMVRTGKMHGYMRMYWAKKILEWTDTPEQALEFAIKLNDTYELDGYDPNGYVGCMWSIAGVHDHGWPERDIFGKIRYMNYGGLKRKFDIEAYIKRWVGESR